MSERINGKTPDEIKKGLRHCSEDGCKGCPYEEDCHLSDGGSELAADALVYIQQLESRIDTLTAKAVLFDKAVATGEKYKRERDAAVADVKSLCATNYFSGNFCTYCKYNEPDGQCFHHCVPYSPEWGWEWHGVQEASNAEEA